MKLLFYDKFFDSLINLPKGIQKKVIEFQKKFREDSKSSGIHLEPISSFKDQSLRSARVDKTYRAIIKVPSSGEIFYLLWVDHHDKAYNWAENKVFQWNEQTQSMQMFVAPEVVQENAAQTTEETKNSTFFSRFSVDKLLQIGVPEILLPSVKGIDNLEDLEELESYIPDEVFENLFYLLDGANIDQLIYDIIEGKSEGSSIEDQVSSINNQRSFIELTDDEVFNEILNSGLNRWKYYLHPSQRKLVKGEFKGSVKVSGGAGTGKTVAALHRLKFLCEKTSAKSKVLFTTFTNALAANLNDLINGLDIDRTKVEIRTIDSVVSNLITRYNLLPEEHLVFEWSSVKSSVDFWEELLSGELTSFSPEFLDQEYCDVILYNNVKDLNSYLRTSRIGRGKPISRRQRAEIWQLFERFNNARQKKRIYYRDELFNILTDYLLKNDLKVYEYCIVDELQDFSNIELRLVRCLVEEKANDLFMVGDPMQGIYSRKLNFSKVGISIRGKRSRRLRINYRTTEEIKKLALSVIQDCHYDNFDGEEEERSGYISLFHGQKPTYEVFKTKDEELDFVAGSVLELIESGYKPQEIAICSRTKNGIKDFRNKLHTLEIPYVDRSKIKVGSTDSIQLLTLHKIKGLEFKHVFLVDVNNRTIPKIPYDFNQYSKTEQEEYLKREKSLVYVALSRAIENVKISGTGSASELIRV
jgi:mRNA-degrading endonuclease RelE of RelBE toxin-antitoxin system